MVNLARLRSQVLIRREKIGLSVNPTRSQRRERGRGTGGREVQRSRGFQKINSVTWGTAKPGSLPISE